MTKKNWKKRLRSLSLIVGLIFVACSHEEADSLPDAVAATLGISNVYIVGEAIGTRANTTVTSGKMMVYSRTTSYYYEFALVFVCNGGVWTHDTYHFRLNKEPISLYAYYPQDKFTASGTNAKNVSFSARGYSADYDLCYATAAKGTVNAYSPNATFEMTHAYARIRLSITRLSTFTGTGNITAYTLKAATGNIDLDGTLNVDAGTFTSSSPSASGYTYSLNTTVTTGTTNTDCDMLIPPQDTPADGLTITLTIDGSARSVTIPTDKFGDKLNANTQYTVSLKIQSGATLVVETGTVMEEEWTEPTGDFGSVEEFIPPL